MLRSRLYLSLTLLFVVLPSPLKCQEALTDRPWFVSMGGGVGEIRLTSDQSSGTRRSTFALAFSAGHQLGKHFRIGGELGGWLLQASNLNDPTVGEGVSKLLLLGDVFPSAKAPFFLRAGTGLATYYNNRPGGYGGHGWAWTAGAGYEFRLGKRLGLAPIVSFSTGRLGDVPSILTTETGRRYSVVEFTAQFIWHFGKPQP